MPLDTPDLASPPPPAAPGATAGPPTARGAKALTGAALTAVGLVTALLAALVLPGTAASAAPPPITPGYDIEPFAPFQGQTACEAIARPGVTAFRDLVLSTYPETRNAGIVRTCSVRGASEHKEGRAWDWKVDAANPSDAAAVQDLLDWLMATDEYGNSAAMARRLGVMYIIWNSQIWKSYQADRGWMPYRGASSHADHVHISFSWAGALKLTSYWTGQVSSTVQSPIVVVTPSPTASPTQPPDAALGDPLLAVPGGGASASPSASPSVSPSASPSARPSVSPSTTPRASAQPVVKRSRGKASPTRSASPRPSATSKAAATRTTTRRPPATPKATSKVIRKATVTRATDRRGLTGPWRRH